MLALPCTHPGRSSTRPSSTRAYRARAPGRAAPPDAVPRRGREDPRPRAPPDRRRPAVEEPAGAAAPRRTRARLRRRLVRRLGRAVPDRPAVRDGRQPLPRSRRPVARAVGVGGRARRRCPATVYLGRHTVALPCLMEKWVTVRRDSRDVEFRHRLTNLGTQACRTPGTCTSRTRSRRPPACQPARVAARSHRPRDRPLRQVGSRGRVAGARRRRPERHARARARESPSSCTRPICARAGARSSTRAGSDSRCRSIRRYSGRSGRGGSSAAGAGTRCCSRSPPRAGQEAWRRAWPLAPLLDRAGSRAGDPCRGPRARGCAHDGPGRCGARRAAYLSAPATSPRVK